MEAGVEFLLVLLLVTNLSLLGSSRLLSCIQIVAGQGMALGFLPVVAHAEQESARIILFAIGAMLLKGGVLPLMLSRAVREAKVTLEIEPFVGYGLSTLVGLLAVFLSLWLASRLPLPRPYVSPLLVPVALSTMITGMFVIVSRRKAITQAVGYLVLENGISAFGVALVREEPLLMELGVLLDVFVAVFVMGITIFHINRTFDHIDTDQLSVLSDWATSREAPP